MRSANRYFFVINYLLFFHIRTRPYIIKLRYDSFLHMFYNMILWSIGQPKTVNLERSGGSTSWLRCFPVHRTLLIRSGPCSRHWNVMRNHRHTALRSMNGQKLSFGACFSFLSKVLSIPPEDLQRTEQQEGASKELERS